MIEIKNLSVSIPDQKGNKKILDNINLKFEEGKIYSLMGKNGSGKSTLANVLAGNPKYKIISGKILFNKKDITSLPVDQRAKLGMFMSFQMPLEIEGVTIFDFLRTSYNLLNKKISLLQFQKLLKEKCKVLDIPEEFLQRYLNKGFSGGEKKKSEILQMLVLNTNFIVLDETDSGLDIDALKTISKAINEFKKQNPKSTIVIISHYKRIFNYIDSDKVFIISKGKIVKQGNKDLIDEIEEKGYAALKKEHD